jgi:hypothetical protein
LNASNIAQEGSAREIDYDETNTKEIEPSHKSTTTKSKADIDHHERKMGKFDHNQPRKHENYTQKTSTKTKEARTKSTPT